MLIFCYDAVLTEENQKNIYFDFNKFERSVANKLRARTNTFLIKTIKIIGRKLSKAISRKTISINILLCRSLVMSNCKQGIQDCKREDSE